MLVALSAGFVAGVSSQVIWPVLPAVSIALVAGGLACVLARFAGGVWRFLALAAAAAGVGMAWAGWCAGDVIAARLPPALEGRDVVLEGTVGAIRQHADGSLSLQLVVDVLPWQRVRRPWSPEWQVRLSSWQPVAMRPGERWRLVARLKRPHASQNPGVADFERYMLGERVVASGSLRGEGTHVRVGEAGGWAAWRNALLAHAQPLFGAGPGDIAQDDAARFARAVLPALVVDERSLLTGAQWRVLGNTGTAHLVAISGLHVALLWGAVLWVGARVWGRRPGSLRYRAAAVMPALVVAAAYAALAGMPLPAARATLMLAAASFFLLASGTVPAWRVLLASTLCVLVVDPLSAQSTGYWLSFGAVALLLALNGLDRRPPLRESRATLHGRVLAGIRLQTLLSILLAPLLIGLFGAASASSVIANLPAIPLVNLLALPPGLAGFLLAPVCPWLADPCIDLALAALAWLWHLLVWIDGFGFLSPVRAQAATPAGIVALLFALWLLVVARAWPLRLAALPVLLLAWPVADALPSGAADVCVFDVGQGLAVGVRTARHALLYDTGPAWGEDSDAGAMIVVPAARAMGIGTLDMLVVSHDDADHAGGVASVVAALRPSAIVVGDLRTRGETGGRGERCDVAREWTYDGVHFFLFPGDAGGKSNDRSCVLRMAAGGTAILLPGDIGRRRELALAEAWGDRLASDVLVAAHHGSRTSTGPTFLYRVAPSRVIYSAGYRNRFGHPDAEVTERVRRAGADRNDTAREGAVCLRLRHGAPPAVTSARSATRRFWRD